MRKLPPKAVLHWIWANISATVALALIFGAAILGYRMGSPVTVSSSDGAQVAQTDDDGDKAQQMYTCSMHPAVRLPDPDAKCPICFMDLIPVEEDAGGEGSEMRMTLSEAAKTMSQIETAKVGRFFPSAETRLYGNLVYDETSVAQLTAYFPGRIERLFANYIGVSVQKGDHLAELYSPELLAALEELRQAKLSYDQSINGSDFLRSTATQTLTASQEKLRLYGLTQEQIDQVESGEFDSDQLTIYAPIGGIVTHLAAREGDYLKTGAQIATVSDLSRLWLDLEAYESQLTMLRWGMPVTFTVEAHPGEFFTGQVSFIEPIVDEKRRTVAVRVAVDNADMHLKPGMFATATVYSKISAGGAVISDELAGRWVSPMHPTHVSDGPGECPVCGMDMVTAESLGVVGDSSQVEMPLVIPRTAVLFTGARSVVYVQVPDQEQPTYEGRVVVIGPRAGQFYTVRSGLKEGEDVVVNGAFRIDSAMQISAKPSMMMPEGGGGGGGHNHGGAPNAPQMSDMNRVAPEAFIEDLAPIYSAYLDAQERLADDDLNGFLDSAMQLKEAAASVKPVGLVGSTLGIWRRSAAILTGDSSITTIDAARTQLAEMTLAVLHLQDQFGHTGQETMYAAYCPMAFDFEGAKWIQRGTEIKNPYFGSEMLRCGDIQETMPPIGGNGNDEMDMDMDMESMNADEHKGHTND